jgi:hypothetical protein
MLAHSSASDARAFECLIYIDSLASLVSPFGLPIAVYPTAILVVGIQLLRAAESFPFISRSDFEGTFLLAFEIFLGCQFAEGNVYYLPC